MGVLHDDHPESRSKTERKRTIDKLKEWGPLFAACAAVRAVTLYFSGALISNANRNAEVLYEIQKREADARNEALMGQIEALKRDAHIRHEALIRDADTRNEALMGHIESLNRNSDARYEGLMGQIEGVVGQVAGLQKQIDVLQNQFDGLNRNAGARNGSLKGQAESAMQAIESQSREIGAINALLENDRLSGDEVRAIVDEIMAILEALHERVVEFESMIELEDARFDDQFERPAMPPVSTGGA